MTTDAHRRQQVAAAILAHLLTQGLPMAGWEVSRIFPGTLEGHFGPSIADPAHRQEGVAAWAAFLGADAAWQLYPNVAEGVNLHVVAEHQGVKVRVWTRLSLDDLAELFAPAEGVEVGP